MKYLLILILLLVNFPLNAQTTIHRRQYDYKLRGYTKVMTHNGNGYRYAPLFEPVMPGTEGGERAPRQYSRPSGLIKRFPSRSAELQRAYRGMEELLKYPYGNPYRGKY